MIQQPALREKKANLANMSMLLCRREHKTRRFCKEVLQFYQEVVLR